MTGFCQLVAKKLIFTIFDRFFCPESPKSGFEDENRQFYLKNTETGFKARLFT